MHVRVRFSTESLIGNKFLACLSSCNCSKTCKVLNVLDTCNQQNPPVINCVKITLLILLDPPSSPCSILITQYLCFSTPRVSPFPQVSWYDHVVAKQEDVVQVHGSPGQSQQEVLP